MYICLHVSSPSQLSLPISSPPLPSPPSPPLPSHPLSSPSPLLLFLSSTQLFFVYKEYLPKNCIWAVFFFAAVIVVQSVVTDFLVFSYDRIEEQ